MKHTKVCLLAALVSALLLLLAACAAPDTSDREDDPMGPAGPAHSAQTESQARETAKLVNYAPDFEVLDNDGNTVRLSDFRGKPVVLNFWATWCQPCKAELPDFDRSAATYGDEVTFLMVNLTDGGRDTVSGVREFVAANGYTFPVYFDTRYSAANAYRVSSIPTTYFINAEGEIVSYKVGMVSASELEKGIQSLLK